MFSQKSVLARLLANENIAVQQGNFETAYFDVQSRTLGLPIWKEMSKDVFDMLIGHEVAHALFTPTDFNKYMSEGIPHSWLNIVEDVRIEKLILRKYPGLVANFKRGYSELMLGDINLFGLRDQDISALGFMDRLNIHAKARDMIEVPFADDELPYVAQVKACETYEDVVQACRDIQAWLKEKADDNSQNEMPQDSNGDDEQDSISVGSMPAPEQDADEQDDGDTAGQGEDTDAQDGEQNSSQTDADAQDGEQNSSQTGADTQDGDDQSDAEDSAQSSQEPQSGDANQESLTEKAYQENSSELIDTNATYIRGLTRQQAMDRILPYSVVAEGRRKCVETASSFTNVAFPEDEYTNFVRDSKQIVNLMVKEFEMRKTAWRSLRARQSTKGSLDVNKLHKYQYDDMLFKQVSQMADAKNHGMVMLIDYSGSMYTMLPDVIRQMLTLTMFCKRVGIPFEVYSFTSINDEWKPFITRQTDRSITSVYYDELGLIKLFGSDMSKRDYDEAFRMMFWQTVKGYRPRSSFEELGNTPLNTALMAMQYVIQDFRSKYAVQKMNFVSLTDGDSNSLAMVSGDDNQSRSWNRGNAYIIDVNGKTFRTKGTYTYGRSGRDITAGLVKMIGDMGVTCVNYYVSDRNYDLSGEISISLNTRKGKQDHRDARRELTKNGVFIVDNNQGYDRRFIIKTDAAFADVESLEVNSDMSVSKIAKAFTKSNGSKKKSKILTQKFAELVA